MITCRIEQCKGGQQCHLRHLWEAVALKIQALQVGQARQAVRQVHHPVVAQIKGLQSDKAVHGIAWQCFHLTEAEVQHLEASSVTMHICV